MEILEKYAKVSDKLSKLNKEIKFLEGDSVVQEYRVLLTLREVVEKELASLYEEKREHEFEQCNHIWVHSNEKGKQESSEFCRCIKCGLNRGLLQNELGYLNYLIKEEQEMYDFMLKHVVYFTGIELNIACDYDLAKALYQRIKEKNPDIDDATISQYLENALADMNKIKVSPDRERIRAKRLLLDENFNRWQSKKVK